MEGYILAQSTDEYKSCKLLPKVELPTNTPTTMEEKKKRRFARPTREEMEEFRKFLGPELAAQYSVGELVQLRYEMDAIAKLLLAIYIYKTGSNPEEV